MVPSFDVFWVKEIKGRFEVLRMLCFTEYIEVKVNSRYVFLKSFKLVNHLASGDFILRIYFILLFMEFLCGEEEIRFESY